MQHLPLGCLVMASGQSKRFGSNKLLAPFGEKPLLAYTLSQIPKELFSRCIVVTRTPECCSIAVNAGFTPILHSLSLRRDAIRLGIEQMEGMAGCLVVQADQPLCLPQSYKNLVEHFYQHPQGFFRLGWQSTAASPVLFPAHSFGKLRSLPEKSGGSGALPKDSTNITVVSALYPWELEDADTPQQLEHLLHIAQHYSD